MSRPAKVLIEPHALLHNIARIRHLAPGKQMIAMVKSNAYGCGVRRVIPVIDGQVDAFGVACIEEALAIRALGSRTACILFQGIFTQDELHVAVAHQFACVLNQAQQLQWLLNTPLVSPIKIWVKVDTGMHRLGFQPHEVQAVMSSLQACPWVDKEIGLMTHFACADEPSRAENEQQISLFQNIKVDGFKQRTMANSAAIVAFPQAHADAVRPGIMLYGVSPFAHKSSLDLGLIPVMRFVSALTSITHYPAFSTLGYGGTWFSDKPSIIGVVAVGYGDGYPRHIAAHTPVSILGQEVPIVGRVSMDMLTVDLTQLPEAKIGDAVELWGTHLLVERIAQSANTLAYELLCQITERPRS